MATLKGLTGEDVAAFEIEYRIHATRRMFLRGIFNAHPFDHLLINGRTRFGSSLHVAIVINTSERQLSIITTYEPDRLKWTNDYSRRR